MKVLVGYMPNPRGRAALDAGISQARLNDAELIVSQHVPVMSSEEQGAETPAVRDAMQALEQELRGDGLRVRTRWSVGGSAAKALLSLAEEEAVDLLVIGIRRRSPVGKALLGSDAQDILLRAPMPVLAVKADSEP